MSDEIKNNNVDVTLLVKTFVDMYLKDKVKAVFWANNQVDSSLYPLMRPKIQEALIKRGYKAKAEAFKDGD